ncbi:proline--tRNA ligase [Marinicrinis lubricantis]|uniref:Proline--tRNA ligase n=1 Tax=Marinicrinis lubricantis TaxID=2086470 RepID=A0ABW1IJ73_9BACL
MRQHHYLFPTLRKAPSDAEAVSHQLLLRAGLVRPLAAGIYTYLPLGLRVLKKVSSIIQDEMEQIGFSELLMPAMQPAELWKTSGRYEVYGPELIRFHDRHAREFALGPTHEEVITSLIGENIASYRDLPLKLFQIQTKFRDEQRPRFGLLRGREFMMKDAYSFEGSWAQLDRTYLEVYEAYLRIFERCGLHVLAVEADAGAIGGEGETHEFIAPAAIGEDTVAICSQCGFASNLEVMQPSRENQTDDSPSCPHCSGNLQLSRGIELGHVFKLGTKYSSSLNASCLGPDGKWQPVIMGCYGIGVSRILSAVIEQHHDAEGIVWPSSLAPFQVHLIPVSMQDSQQMNAAETLYRQLCDAGIETLLDDREERPGVKFKDSDLIGIPVRIVIGKQAGEGFVEWKDRDRNIAVSTSLESAFVQAVERFASRR